MSLVEKVEDEKPTTDESKKKASSERRLSLHSIPEALRPSFIGAANWMRGRRRFGVRLPISSSSFRPLRMRNLLDQSE